ncbi:hypothetical protein CYMTET_26100 [Cymbomonas tetramitiformis]|uniref:Uncharacterized protein n=1 Tax=Cymbomonas tetramitiformis TaxID=36881 RepID=A0AAE0FSH4_9CHLO|nr:hypothetical protein CYMTET_26100 [Cymbomonas tetramitiformis]
MSKQKYLVDEEGEVSEKVKQCNETTGGGAEGKGKSYFFSASKVFLRLLSPTRGKVLKAIKQADVEGLKALHEAGEDVVGCVYENKLTALHKACDLGHTSVVSCLVDFGAKINAADQQLWTPLHFAVQETHHACLRVLLNAGADVNLRNRAGATALHMAVINKDTVSLALLIRFKANINSKTESGLTPVRLAKATDSEKCLWILEKVVKVEVMGKMMSREDKQSMLDQYLDAQMHDVLQDPNS